MLIRRAAWFLAALVALAAFAWLGVQVYVSRAAPERFRAWNGRFAWIVGPPPEALEKAAEEHVRLGLERLNDRSLPAGERVGAYREELRKAEALLVRSLRAQPAQARALAQLAAVRWELQPPLDEEGVRSHLAMIELASAMAPTAPGIQARLGELLLKMGRRDEAVDYLARAVKLNAEFVPQVVSVMRDNLFDADEILSALPSSADLLAGLLRPFLEDGGEARYRDAIEDLLAAEPSRSTVRLLQSYGTVCLALDQPARLRGRLEELGPLEDADAEAARWGQMAKASLALGEPQRAIDEARSGFRVAPDSPVPAEDLGDVALRAGDAALAIEAYRDALRRMAQNAADPSARAGIYDKVGRAEEQLGRPDRAYDDYRRALRLDPAQQHARKRIEEMEAAAGLGAGER